MFQRLSGVTRQLRWKVHGFALGMTLALGTTLLGQSCAATGQ